MDLTIERTTPDFRSKTLLVTKTILAVSFLALFLFYTFDLLLLIFLGLLFAVFFMGIAGFVSRKTPLSYKWSLAVVLIALTVSWVGAFYLMAPSIGAQFSELGAKLPVALSQVESWVNARTDGQELLGNLNLQELLSGGAGGALTKATGALTGLAQGLINIFIVLFIGIYIAAAPDTYKRGFLYLVPLPRRERMNEVLEKTGFVLRWWLIGRFCDMLFVGILTWVGLMLLGIPLATVLAIIAAVTNFIPNIGPFIGAIPAILIALGKSPESALHVALLFTAIQSIESVWITPMIQQKAIHLPPAFTIITQVIMGVAFGTIGLTVATPLVAAGIVMVKYLYVKDMLGDPTVDVAATE
jgi:predicted PurR-regulated permease PerM